MAHLVAHIQKLLESRYYLRSSEGSLLENDPEQIFTRVAYAVAGAEKDNGSREAWAEEFYFLMQGNKFLPNTPLLANAGKEGVKSTYAACNVLEIPDSMEGIFQTLKDGAIISKFGGGLGLYFSNLREEGALVKGTGHKSTGPISFMRVFNEMCNCVAQGGMRRGAMLAVLNIDHPDIEKFISCKDDGVSFSNFNISVSVTDKFMKAVEEDKDWSLKSPGSGLFVGGYIKARTLWNKIVEHAWKTGDPGLIFIDEANRKHPFIGNEYDIKCYNACGELGLLHAESCNLGHINLMAYLKNEDFIGKIGDEFWVFDWDSLAKDIPTMVRFLDDVIDTSPYPLPEIEEATKKTRKLGLGIMGWADALIKMQIPYDSDEAVVLAEKLMMFINDRAVEVSKELAEEKGVFPVWEDSTYYPATKMRNATLTTIAPTGTTSRIVGVSSGIEPNFAWKTHHNLEGLEYDETHWAVEECWPEGVYRPVYMKIANEIPWEWHLKHQIAFQKHVGSNISKTINLPTEATKEEVEKIYWEAWKNKLKGITVYRNNSKTNQPLNKIEQTVTGIEVTYDAGLKSTNTVTVINNLAPKQEYKKRGLGAAGVTFKVDTGKGKIYITVNYSEYHAEPVEIFIRLGHATTPSEQALADWTGRLISVMLKYNIPLESIIRQGNKVYSDTNFWFNQKSFQSLPKLISYLLGFTFEEALQVANIDVESMLDSEEIDWDGKVETFDEQAWPKVEKFIEEQVGGGYCYACGSYSVVVEGNCKVCTNCGESRCG